MQNEIFLFISGLVVSGVIASQIKRIPNSGNDSRNKTAHYRSFNMSDDNSVVMTKGETVSLTKKAPGLTAVFAAVGWDMKKEGASMDLDLAAFLLDSNGKLQGKGDFVYFGHKESACKSVASRGDNLTGEGEGDDETIDVNLATIPTYVSSILFVASIYQGKSKGQSLKDLDNAFIRIVNAADQKELTKFTISDTDSSHESFILGSLNRDADGWSFKAIGEADARELGGFASSFGLSVAA